MKRAICPFLSQKFTKVLQLCFLNLKCFHFGPKKDAKKNLFLKISFSLTCKTCHCLGDIEIIAAPSEFKKLSVRLSFRQFTVCAMASHLFGGTTHRTDWFKIAWAALMPDDMLEAMMSSIFEASFMVIHPVWGMRCLSPYTWNSSVLHLKNRINLSSGNPHNNVAIGRSSRPPSWHKNGVENSLRTAFWWLFEVEISTYSIHKQEKCWTYSHWNFFWLDSC